MIENVTYACLALLAVAVLAGIYRIAAGPTALDRMLAFDLVAVSGVGMVAILSILWQTADYLELILVYSLLGFLGTVAFAYYLGKSIARRPPGDLSPEDDHD